MNSSSQILLLAGVLVFSACSSSRMQSRTAIPVIAETRDSVTILRPDHQRQGNATILSVIQSMMPGVRVDRRDSSGCADVQLRQRRTLKPGQQPAIYVEGQRTANTCVLDILNIRAFERVEVYHSNQTVQAGRLSNEAGMILIFLRAGVGV